MVFLQNIFISNYLHKLLKFLKYNYIKIFLIFLFGIFVSIQMSALFSVSILDGESAILSIQLLNMPLKVYGIIHFCLNLYGWQELKNLQYIRHYIILCQQFFKIIWYWNMASFIIQFFSSYFNDCYYLDFFI